MVTKYTAGAGQFILTSTGTYSCLLLYTLLICALLFRAPPLNAVLLSALTAQQSP